MQNAVTDSHCTIIYNCAYIVDCHIFFPTYVANTDAGVLVGGVVGGLLALLLLVAGILIATFLGFFVCRRKTMHGMHFRTFVTSAAVVDPCTHTLCVV